MGKFLSTILSLIIAGVAFCVFWFFIPLVSALFSLAPFFVALFICGLIFLASFFGIKIFKTKYLKVLPIIMALILGGATVGTIYARFERDSYHKKIIVSHHDVYNKFGNEILSLGYHEDACIRSDKYGKYMIVTAIYNYPSPRTYSIYTLDGICVARDVTELDDYDII